MIRVRFSINQIKCGSIFADCIEIKNTYLMTERNANFGWSAQLNRYSRVLLAVRQVLTVLVAVWALIWGLSQPIGIHRLLYFDRLLGSILLTTLIIEWFYRESDLRFIILGLQLVVLRLLYFSSSAAGHVLLQDVISIEALATSLAFVGSTVCKESSKENLNFVLIR